MTDRGFYFIEPFCSVGFVRTDIISGTIPFFLGNPFYFLCQVQAPGLAETRNFGMINKLLSDQPGFSVSQITKCWIEFSRQTLHIWISGNDRRFNSGCLFREQYKHVGKAPPRSCLRKVEIPKAVNPFLDGGDQRLLIISQRCKPRQPR